jgi:2,3-dihydroxyphenylpropionate 1,2-dioxygenase
MEQAMQHSRPGIVGAAIVPHAPQLLSLPSTEDKAQVARVRSAMHKIGEGLRALAPDLVIVISNAHGEDLVVQCVPSFLIHCGRRAEGVNLHRGWWPVDGEAGYELVRHLLDDGFDPAFSLDAKLGTAFTIPLDFCGFPREMPSLPIFCNAYVPPQPRPERCFAFGKVLARSLEAMGRRAVVIVSGGLSHFPGTPHYPHPDIATDRTTFERIADGNLQYIMTFDEIQLDRTGNVECRTLQILAGAIGNRTPNESCFEPSWHHIYAVFGWTTPLTKIVSSPIYSGIPAERSELARALHAIVVDEEARTAFIGEPNSFASQFALKGDEAAALIALDETLLRERFSINAMLTYQAKLRLASMPSSKSTETAK